jgi:hypothetical protein
LRKYIDELLPFGGLALDVVIDLPQRGFKAVIEAQLLAGPNE